MTEEEFGMREEGFGMTKEESGMTERSHPVSVHEAGMTEKSGSRMVLNDPVPEGPRSTRKENTPSRLAWGVLHISDRGKAGGKRKKSY